MQLVMEFEQEKVDMQKKKKKNRDERQLTKSRCMAAPPFQKVTNIYIYIYIYIFIIYIYSEKKEKKKRRKIGFEVSPTGRT